MALPQTSSSPENRNVKYVLAGESFKTKKALTERVLGILYGEAREIVGQDFRLLKALFLEHPSKAHKRTSEKARIYTTAVSGRGRRFDIQRTDGSTEDISYRKCLDALSGRDTYKISVTQAIRWGVQDQIEAFRRSQPLEIAYAPDMQVDHEYPHTFSQLIKDFCASEGIALGDIKLIGRPGWASEIAEPYGSRWRDYHRKHARLRMLSKPLNCRYGNRSPEAA